MIFRLYSNFFRRPPSSGSYRTRGREVPGKKFRVKGRDFRFYSNFFRRPLSSGSYRTRGREVPGKKFRVKGRDFRYYSNSFRRPPSSGSYRTRGREVPGKKFRVKGRDFSVLLKLLPTAAVVRELQNERSGGPWEKISELRDVISAILGHPSDGRRRPGATEGEDGLTSPSVTRRRPGATEGGGGERTDANYR